MGDMFCFQCEQTAGGKGCTKVGVCGKTADVSNKQDELTGALVGLARAAAKTAPSKTADELMMLALDAGAEDFSEEEDSYEVYTAPEDFSAVRETLEKEGVPMLEADVTMIPQTWTELTDEESIKKMNRILDLLDDDDDVQAVYHNWDE